MTAQLVILPAEGEDMQTKLDRAFKHLLDRVLGNAEMSVAEETAALKASAGYAQMKGELGGGSNSGNEGTFNGFRDTASRFSAPRGRGHAPSDGGTIDADADPF